MPNTDFEIATALELPVPQRFEFAERLRDILRIVPEAIVQGVRYTRDSFRELGSARVVKKPVAGNLNTHDHEQ